MQKHRIKKPNCNLFARKKRAFAMAGKIRRFFRIILPSVLDEKKMVLPVKFVKLYGNELADEVTLTLPNGCGWRVGLIRTGGEVWLGSGWQQFMERNSFRLGHFLIFEYKDPSNFRVDVFDMSTCEDEKYLPEKKERNACPGRPRSAQAPRKDKAKRAVAEGEKSKGVNSFKMVMKSHNIYNHTAYIPVEFARKHLRKVVDHVKLLDANGKEWIIKTNKRADVEGLNLTVGWGAFIGYNKLKEQDRVVFEHIDSDDVVLKTTILRSNKKSSAHDEVMHYTI